MKNALEVARKDVSIKERYLITPASLNALTSLRTSGSRSPKHERRGYEGPASEGRWNTSQKKGKGKGGKNKSGLLSQTPDGRQICYRWNSMKERCRFNCGRLHICQRCMGQHPVHMCTEGKKPKDTQGGDPKGSKPN